MATLDYINIPPGATRLRTSLSKDSNNNTRSEIRPVPRITTSLPHPSPPPSPTTFKRKTSLLSSTADALASPTLSLIPQMLLSSTLPPLTPTDGSGSGSQTGSGSGSNNQRRKDEIVLLSTKDPLSLPIMSVNFKRFVSIIGPVFWLQDRVEEIVLWKRGWMRTAVWMAAYAFLCFYPRLVLLVPHIALIGIILSTYPYPAKASADPLTTQDESLPGSLPPTEGSVPWQANITGIQNLMGSVADLHDLIQPYIYHLYLTPAHLASRSQQQKPPQTQPNQTHHSPYTPHILQLLLLSFFPLLLLISLPQFPLREVFLVCGLLPFVGTHPAVRKTMPVVIRAVGAGAPLVVPRFSQWRDRVGLWKDRVFVRLGLRSELEKAEETVEEIQREIQPVPLSMVLQRVMDDDRLSDECWNSEMREVYLWENERFGGPLPVDASPSKTNNSSSSNSSSSILAPQKGWSKQNLRPGERTGWTRGRDGWNGGGGGSGVVEGTGEVSSNLTFSLAPGWAFVESEDWRKDLQCSWSGCGGDAEGWVYTNDIWLGSRPAPYTSGGGSVTRRRRWIRRVWYDPKRASADS